MSDAAAEHRSCSQLLLSQCYDIATGRQPSLVCRSAGRSCSPATMTSKVAKLQRACLRDPVKVEADAKYQTVSTLRPASLCLCPSSTRRGAREACVIYASNTLQLKRLHAGCLPGLFPH